MNKIEKLKLELPPHLFKDRLESLDYFNLSEADRFYLKSFGIYNIKLRADKFMIRVRFDGLNISISELEIISNIAREFKLNIILTARGGLELHHISPENIYPIYKRLSDSKIKTHQSLTDNFRSLVADPLSDFTQDSYFKIAPILNSIREFFLDNPEFFGLIPRKFNTAIVSRIRPIDSFWGNDALFAIARSGDELGFNLYLGGKNSEVARDTNIFISPDDTKELFIAIARVFNETGLRGSRSKTRLFHLIDTVGIRRVRDKIEQKFKRELPNAGTLLLKSPQSIDTLKLRDGYFGRKIYSKYGEVSLDRFEEIIKLSREYEAKIRFGIDQNIYLISKKPLSEPIQSSKRLNIIACVGSRYCPLSLWDIKKDVDFLPTKRLEELRVRVGFSGCLKGCGRHYHSDIGLIGLRTNLYAPTERAFRVFLGGVYDQEPTPAQMLYYSVPKREINSLIGVILDDFEASGYGEFMEFSKEILTQYSPQTLQLWFLLRVVYDISSEIREIFLKANEKRLLEAVSKELGFGKELEQDIRELSHRAWDLK